MSKQRITLFITLILVVLLQVFVFDNLLFFHSGFVPFIYIFPVVFFPLGQSRIFFLSYAFLLGILMDALSGPWGVHSFSIVFIAFSRPFFMRLILGISYEDSQFQFGKLNFIQTLVYVFFLSLIYHLVIFVIEFHSFDIFWFRVFDILSACSVTTLIIITIRNIFLKKLDS